MSLSGNKDRGQFLALITFICIIVFVLSFLPLLRLLQEAAFPGGDFSLSAIRDSLADDTVWRATRNTIVVGIGGTVASVVLGVAVALIVTLTDVRLRQTLVLCFVTPLMIAPQVTALAWLQVFGPSSPILHFVGLAPPLGTPNPLYSPEGIVLLLAIQYSPLVFLIVRAGLRQLPRELVEAAQSGGAGPFRIIATIILPLATPAIVAAAALTFVSCVGNFGIPAFLGIPANYLVLPTLIFQRLAGGGPDVLAEVAVLSILIAIIAMIGIFLQDYFSSRRDYRISGTSAALAPYALGRWRLPVEAMMWLLMAVILVLPLTGLILTSLVRGYGVTLTADSVTLENYRFVMVEHAAAQRAFANSFMLSVAAAVFAMFVAIPLGYVIAWHRGRWTKILNIVVEMPYALPGVVLSIAAILLFLKPIPVLGVQLYNTVWIILFAYLARFLVLGVRPVVNGYLQIDRALEEAAQIGGARLLTRMRTIIFPMIAPAAMAGGLLIFMTALSELTVSALLWSSGAETLGVVIFSFEQGGDTKYAAAISALLVAFTFMLMLAANLFAHKLPKGVLPWRD
ncbi:iron ABC transporter permease [Roseobacter sp. N2S]|uniref:ABC transporter permease n=1 Tax=Roseobacter sp. N2S TaxID=2663844 RepID=UPI00285C3B02|nr:iron ABC transporter permease [Roseobacter sp. N2S]MDR6265812.1 iron(III) transport system permease protein [Roseobacter sp. N2S]